MSFANANFPAQRRLTDAESAKLTREVIDRAQQALRKAQAERGIIRPRQQIEVPRLRPILAKLRRMTRYGPGFEPGLIAICLIACGTGAVLHH